MRVPKRIKVAPDRELARLLEEAKRESLLLDVDGTVFRLALDEEVTLGGGYYDPEEVRRTLGEMAGIISREEAVRGRFCQTSIKESRNSSMCC